LVEVKAAKQRSTLRLARLDVGEILADVTNGFGASHPLCVSSRPGLDSHWITQVT
jgi:hypothetical protein